LGFLSLIPSIRGKKFIKRWVFSLYKYHREEYFIQKPFSLIFITGVKILPPAGGTFDNRKNKNKEYSIFQR